jgi:3-demethoxyubiquinol 3-hydroxylase
MSSNTHPDQALSGENNATDAKDVNTTNTLSVMFDGSCPLCLKEISLYRSAQALTPINWVDVRKTDNCLPTQRQQFMSRFHVQQTSGQMLSGAAAFVALWENMPGWRWLAAFIKKLHLTPLLEFAYVRFLVIRPSLQRIVLAANTNHLPKDLIADIRSDHAGETGAVYIYKGILAVTKNPEVIAFATHHLQTEQEHLRQINLLLPVLRRSVLLPGWKIAGFLTGALPAMFGANAVFATIEAVETFVDQHYAYQITALNNREQYATIRKQLLVFQADEISHRDEARANQHGPTSKVLKAWCAVVGWGSALAVKLAKLI